MGHRRKFTQESSDVAQCFWSPIYRLPIELVIYVFELLYLKNTGLPDRNTLDSCSQVCTCWRDPAQELLFRYGFLKHDLSDAKQLAATFSSVRGIQLGLHVRRIAITVDEGIGSTITMPSYSPHDLVAILSLFPKLYELDLRSLGSKAETELIKRLDGNHDPLPQLRSLKLYGFGSSTSLLYRLLLLWPTIQFLTFYTTRPIPPPPSELPTAQLIQLGYSTSLTLETLQWLVPNPTLRILQAKSKPDTSTAAFVTLHGPYLRSLQVPALNAVTSPLVQACECLEELDIMRMSTVVPEGAIAALPRTIEHVRIRAVTYAVPSIVAIVLSLPRLRIITLQREGRHALSPENTGSWETFETECVGRGITIAYVDSEKDLDDDPVITDQFPRGRSVAHLGLMN